MKRNNKKVLYESIMTSVAKEVKKVLNEGEDLDKKIRINALKRRLIELENEADELFYKYGAEVDDEEFFNQASDEDLSRNGYLWDKINNIKRKIRQLEAN